MRLNDPKILSIPIEDELSTLVDFSKTTSLKYGPSLEIPNNQDYTKLRSKVINKLEKAQEKLPDGISLCIYEGYRSFKTQELIYNNFFTIVKNNNPNLSDEELHYKASRLVSPVINPDGSKNISPHSTGGAVDLYLIDEKGEVLDMGIHPKDWMQDVDGSLSMTNSMKISQTAKDNRAIMSEVLSAVGLINYPNEFWHWSYGDKFWAYITGNKNALYGAIE